MNTVFKYKMKDEISPLSQAMRYPKIRYMGSKYKLLDWIFAELNKLEFGSSLDAFSGSGAVSYLMKAMGKTVYSNDFLHFSYIIAKAATENSHQKISKGDIDILLKNDKEAPSFIFQTYRDIFYTYKELKFLDTVYFNIKKLNNQFKKALAMTALLRSCVKKQPRGVFTISGDMSKYDDGRRDLRLSIKQHFLEQIEIYNEIVINNQQKNKSFYGDIFDFKEKIYKPDLVYFDPPYVPRADDNCYIKRYHFLEGLSKYWENEEILYDTKVKKIKKKFTPFSYRRTACEAFELLFKKFSNSILVLSYSSNGYPDPETLVGIMKKTKSIVNINEKDHKYHFGNHSSVKRSNVKEYLIIGR